MPIYKYTVLEESDGLYQSSLNWYALSNDRRKIQYDDEWRV